MARGSYLVFRLLWFGASENEISDRDHQKAKRRARKMRARRFQSWFFEVHRSSSRAANTVSSKGRGSGGVSDF